MRNSDTFTCPVCGFAGLSEPPYDAHGCASFEICPSCGTEFGYDDATWSHADIRKAWVAAGCPWRSQIIHPAPDWNAGEQLQNAEFQSWILPRRHLRPMRASPDRRTEPAPTTPRADAPRCCRRGLCPPISLVAATPRWAAAPTALSAGRARCGFFSGRTHKRKLFKSVAIRAEDGRNHQSTTDPSSES